MIARTTFCWLAISAMVLLGPASAPAATAAEPPSPTCVRLTVVSTKIGPTIKVLKPGERLVEIRWTLSDGHTYASQTGDDVATAGKPAMKAADELRPAGAAVQRCTYGPDAGPYRYTIHTLDDHTNRAAKRLR